MSGPRVSSGKDSAQEVGTPRAFLDAVEARFGKLAWDLAANESNHVTIGVVRSWLDARRRLSRETMVDVGWLVLAESAVRRPGRVGEEVRRGKRCAWWAKYVDGKALALFLSPRMAFVGHTQSYPKDLALAVYGEKPGYECWRWRP